MFGGQIGRGCRDMCLQVGAFAGQDERPLDEGVIGGAFEVLENVSIGELFGQEASSLSMEEG